MTDGPGARRGGAGRSRREAAPGAAPERSWRLRLREHGWLGLVAAGALLPLLVPLALGHTLAWRDTSQIFAPVRTLVVEALRRFELPLWNPHEALGMPLLAQLMHAVLHPVSIVAALVAPDAGPDLLICAHVLLAATGAAVLARGTGASRPAAALAGFAYGLSGYVLGMTSILQYVGAAGTAPWAVAALRATGAAPGRAPWAALAICALHLAGDPQWTIVAVALGAALAVEAGGLRAARGVAVAVVLGTALAAVQLLPAAAYLPHTFRGEGLSPEDRATFALSPWRLIELVAPGFFSARPGVSLDLPVFRWLGGPQQEGMGHPFVPSVFVGAPVLVLAALGLNTSRTARVLGGAALVSLWIALGPALGAEPLLRHVPIWGDFRFAEKLVGPLTLCLAVLAAMGADRLASDTVPRRRLVSIAVGAGGAALVFAALLASGFPGAERFSGAAARVALPAARAQLATGLVHAAVALLALAALAYAAASRARPAAAPPAAGASPEPAGAGAGQGTPAAAAPPRHARAAWSLALLVFASAVAAAPFALHAGARGAREERPLAGLAPPAAGGSPTRIVTLFPEPARAAPPGLDGWDAAVFVQSRMGVAPYAVPSHIDHLSTYTGFAPSRFMSLAEGVSARLGPGLFAAMSRFALTHVVFLAPATAAERRRLEPAISGGAPVPVQAGLPVHVWAVPHRPWALFAPAVRSVADERSALELAIEAVSRGDPTVVVEGEVPASPGGGEVHRTWRGVRSLRVDATCEGACVLVVNDAFLPGWKATLDGREVPVLRADGAVRAVVWPAGRHVLELRYQPDAVVVGGWVSAASALALAGASLLVRRRAGATRPA